MGKFNDAYENFRAVQNKWSNFGACDTEPRCVFFELIESVHKGIDPPIPVTAEQWQLYSDMPGVKEAAKALAKAARAVVKAAKADAIGTARFVNYY